MTQPISRNGSNVGMNTEYQTSETRPRQTVESDTRFTLATQDLLIGTLTGAAAVLAGPAGAMAVAGAGNVIRGSAQLGSPGAAAIGGPAAAIGTTATGAAGPGYMSDMERIQTEGFQNSAYLLSLQEQMQNENRQFTAVSNVLRAKHDTAKAALNNVRS